MHTRFRLSSLILLLGVAGCYTGSSFIPEEMKDIAGKTGDIFGFLAVQRSDQVVMGNAELGTAAPMTGRRVSLGLRASRTSQDMPRLSEVPLHSGAYMPGDIPVDRTKGTAFSVDGAAHLWRGFAMGDGHVVGVDLLASVTILPSIPSSGFHLDGGRTAGTFGVRLGVLEETARRPGVSFVLMGRFLPGMTFSTDPVSLQAPETGTVRMQLSSRSSSTGLYRLAASKQFGGFSVTAGYGGDQVLAEGTLSAQMTRPGLPDSEASWYIEESDVGRVTRTNGFVGAGYSFGDFTIAAEVGRLGGNFLGNGGSRFGGKSSWSRNYANVGVRVTPP